MREREELSGGERDYISSKITGRKVASFFLPGLGQIWSRRRGLFWGTLCFGVGLCLLAAIGGGDGAEGAGVISWLVSMILTLINFTKEAYKHDMPYFQRYLDEYAELNGGKVKRQKRTNLYDDDEDIENKPIIHQKKSTGKYNKYGFDEEGYNREGYDAYGFDRDGYNREGYNDEGYDKFGFDKNGYNYKGFDKNGFDRDGYDRRGFNKNGYDRDGYDEYGDKKGGEKKKATPNKNSTVLSGKSGK